jgi:hypothetical protein
MHAFNKTKTALASDSSIRLVVEEVDIKLSAKLNSG